MSNKRAYYEELLKNENIRAWLNTIASCEGANYDTIVTYKKASNFRDHPRLYVPSVNSDAAGRYQFLSTTWDDYKGIVGVKDFTPRSQDLVAVVLIDVKNRALSEALRGDIRGTLEKISHEWASLPPFRYGGQGVCSISDVERKFKQFKGQPLPNANIPLPGEYPSNGEQSTIPSASGILSAVLSGENCDPPPFTTADRIIYTGCASKIASARSAGTGYPYPAPSMGILDKGGQPSLGMSPIPFNPKPGGFITPTKGSFTSGYGWRWGRMHNGVDIANNVGTPILAAAGGKIEIAGWIEGYGNAIYIRHATGWVTRYGHLSSIGVRVGQSVNQGALIGRMGSTGNSTGPHLHFEIRDVSNRALNPVNFIKL